MKMCQRCERVLNEWPSSNPWWNYHGCPPLDKEEKQELFKKMQAIIIKSVEEADDSI